MKTPDIKLWHVATLMSPFLIGLFKEEISNMVFAVSTIRSRKYDKSQKIQIMSNSGDWETFVIIDYHYSVPFRKKRGGVALRGIDSEGKEYFEKISFPNWKTLRTRTKLPE